MGFKGNSLWLGLALSANCGVGTVFAADGSTSDSEATLQEITVTAQKRSESAQKTPESVTVVTGAELTEMGGTDIRTVGLLTPSVQFAYESNVAQQFIRGIGSNLDYAWVPEAVAFNLNGTQITRFASMTTLFDINRVEVAPGPQGTLYGGSASGGVINVTTNRPTATQSSSVLADIGSYGTLTTTVVNNTPINDELFVRAAVNISRHNGYQSIGSDDDFATSGRLSAVFNPNGGASIYLWTQFYQDRPKPSAVWFVNPDTSDPWRIPSMGPPFAIPANGLFPGSPSIYYPPNSLSAGRADYNAFMAGAEADIHLSGVTLSYIPSAVIYTDHDLRMIVGFNQTFDVDIHSYQQELRLTSDAGSALQWIGGLYWKRDDTIHSYLFGPYLSGGTVPDNRTNYSAYGQATYSATNSLRLTAGARFSHDETDAQNAIFVYPTCSAPQYCSNHQLDEGTQQYSVNESWSHADWKVGAEFDVAPQSMVYATIQTGYNPGTFNPQPSTSTFNNAVNSQTLVSYTIGSKNRFWNDKLQINDELYDYEYKDLIIENYSAATGANAYFNAPKSRIYGNELTGIALITPNTQINLGIGLLHARIIDFTDNGANYAGSTLMYSPDVTVTLGVQHTQPLASGGSIVAQATSHYEDGYWAGITLNQSLYPSLFQKSFTTSEASLMYHSADNKWSVGLWGKNLENKGLLGAGSAVSPGVGAAFYEPPRTYGLRFEFKQ